MKRRRYNKLLASVYGTPWAILAPKLQEIMGVLELRERGVRLTRSEIEARIGQVDRPPLVTHLMLAGESGSSRSVTAQPRIAVLNMFGVMAPRMNLMMEISGGTSTELFGKAFDQAVADESIRAIILNCDSPGGAVNGTRELADKIYSARGTKPIVAIANPLMASACYYAASAADEIVATPSATDIGSIGVLFVHREESRANDEAGLTYTIVRSVDNKAEGSPWEPLSESARQHIEAKAASLHRDFITAIAKHRGIKVGAVDEKFGEGRSYLAADALARGMIDRIITFEALVSELTERVEASESTPAAQTRRKSPVMESTTMNPMLRMRLVQLGLAKPGDTDAQFQAALTLLYQALGREQPTDPTQILKDLEPQLHGGAVPPTRTAPELSAFDLVGLVSTAGASLSPEARLTLQNDLLRTHQATPLSLSQALDRINKETLAGNPPAGQRIEVTADRRDKFEAAARDAIVCATFGHALPKQIYDYRTDSMVDWKPGDAQRRYGLQSPTKIAQQCLIEYGLPVQKVLDLSKAQVCQLMCGADPVQMGLGGFLASVDAPAYNLTGMFSNILLDAGNVVLRKSYNDGKTTFQLWMKQGESLEDFKPVHKAIAGELGDPKAVPEDGEFEETTLSDAKESYKLAVWGEVFSHSWQVMVNDRLGSFTEIPIKQGRALRRKQNRLAYQTLKDNAALQSDGVALFHSGTHKNVTTGALTTAADYTGAFGVMARKMREQKGLDAASAALNLVMFHVVFPPAIRDKILTALASQSVNTNGNAGEANIWQGGLNPIEEAELGLAANGSDTAFYGAADANDVDTIEYAYLQGYEAPRMEQAVAFSRLAIRQRIFQPFAVKPLDFRGLQQHTGA